MRIIILLQYLKTATSYAEKIYILSFTLE